MASASRRSTWALVIGVFLATQALLVSLPASSPSGSSCAALRQWAQPYARQSPTLDQLAAFDRPHRMAIFNALTPAARASLWREQLSRFARQPELSSAQRAAIGEAAGMLTPAFYEQDLDARREATRRLWSRAAPLFTTAEQRRPWFELGTVIGGGVARSNAQVPFCECSAGYGYAECYPGHCVSSPCEGWQGCGPIGGDDCIGMCAY